MPRPNGSTARGRPSNRAIWLTYSLYTQHDDKHNLCGRFACMGGIGVMSIKNCGMTVLAHPQQPVKTIRLSAELGDDCGAAVPPAQGVGARRQAGRPHHKPGGDPTIILAPTGWRPLPKAAKRHRTTDGTTFVERPIRDIIVPRHQDAAPRAETPRRPLGPARIAVSMSKSVRSSFRPAFRSCMNAWSVLRAPP